jgi:hypothetical protein
MPPAASGAVANASEHRRLIAEGIWPASGKKSLGWSGGASWHHLEAHARRCVQSLPYLRHLARRNRDATRRQQQTETHKAFIRSRWMPAWVDAVEYGKFGRATVTATLFGGMDASLYADFKRHPGTDERRREHAEAHRRRHRGPTQMAARGSILDVTKVPGEAPLGSSGIQIRFETDLITEGMRPTRIVRIRPRIGQIVHLPARGIPRHGNFSHEDRFPTPAIFPEILNG